MSWARGIKLILRYMFNSQLRRSSVLESSAQTQPDYGNPSSTCFTNADLTSNCAASTNASEVSPNLVQLPVLPVIVAHSISFWHLPQS